MDLEKNGGRVESMIRGMLAFVLLVAVAYAYAQAAPIPGY